MEMQDIAALIQGIVGVLITVCVPVIVKYIQEKRKNEKFDQVMKYAAIAVKFAEQYYAEYDGEAKYNKASLWLSNQLEKIGVELSDAEIRGIIEATLKEFQNEFRQEKIMEVGTVGLDGFNFPPNKNTGI